MKVYKAVIFDMDGTLVDNIPFHKESWMIFLKKHNINLNPDDFHAQNHGNISAMIRRFFGNDIDGRKAAELGEEKEEIYRELYKNSMEEIKGLTSFLKNLRESKIKISLATMGDINNINFILDGLKIREFFHSISGGDDIVNGKPDPEIFNLAVEKLGFRKDECIIFEDSPGGILSAKNAGVDTAGITTSHSEDELKENGCIFTFKDYCSPELYSMILPEEKKCNNLFL